jgi:hypothetical protein
MSLKKVKLIDSNFAHSILGYSSDFQISKYIEWDRQLPLIEGNVVFITDNNCYNVDNIIGKKIAWLMEPKSINPNIYVWMLSNYHKFDTVLSYDKELLSKIPNGEFIIHGMCWVPLEEQKIYEKTKICSIIASGKKQTTGHLMRHDIITRFRDKMDVYGRGYNPVGKKIEALKDYAFSVIIENANIDGYFTEKLLDAITTGTCPIYWGNPSISDFFNIDGIIIIDSINSLQSTINSLSLEKYNSMLPTIEENFEKASKMLLAEDYIFENTNLLK